MNNWIIYFGLFGVLISAFIPAENKQQPCPQHCICSGKWATCSLLNLSSRFENDISNLKISSPSGSNKESLVLSENILKSMGIISLEQLIIENIKITKLDWAAFKNVPIRQLIIRNSIVPEIPKLLFNTVPNLNLIDISNSTLLNFTEIRSETVEQIKLSGCNINEVKPSAFVNCPQLRYLNLAENMLTEFNSSFILDVEQLNLSRNRITKINFEGIKMIDLDLSFNPLTEIIGSNANLEKLKIKSCDLKDLKFLNKMYTIVDLDLSENNIIEMQPTDFFNLVELQTLNLANNKIDFLPPNLFTNNARLYKLILDNNPIKTLPAFYCNDQVTRLKFFSCSSCNIEVLTGNVFQNSPSIISINLSNNKLQQLPVTIFQNVLDLDKIDLSNNLLREIEYDLFKYNTNLKTVKLSKNPLQNLDSFIFRNNKVLKELEINNCNLTKLWETSSKIKIPSITELYAKHNNITIIALNELEITPKLKTFELDNNPLNCDSHLEELNRWMYERQIISLKVKDNLEHEQDINDFPNFSWLQNCDLQLSAMPTDEEELSDEDLEDDSFLDEKDYNKILLDAVKSESNSVEHVNLIDSDEDYEEFKEAVADVISVDEDRFKRQKAYDEVVSFLLPALVFVLTTLIVLIFAVTIILYVMHKRNKKTNMPQINIIPWANSNKTKKHSGSVYRPLSEERIPV